MGNAEYIKLSILVPTIGRVKEVGELLNSIYCSNLNFYYEIIIIDQNNTNDLDSIVNYYSDRLPIKHHKVNFKGLSKAKNYGVKVALGKYISFPDDDCKVLENTYSVAFEILEKENADMVFGKCIDELMNDSVLKFKRQPYTLNKNNMLGGFVEATVICKKLIFDKYQFDENMGAGTFFGAEEGFDWLYRILTQSNFKAYYSPEILFYHPQVIMQKGDDASLKRVFTYRCGSSYLFNKHNFVFKYYKRLLLSFFASIFYFIFNKNFYHYYAVEFYALKLGMIMSKKVNHR